jgi:2-oxoglutarate dehydrogenase E2 component (dihydrolipoamide succinyltransferase)
MSIEIRVPALPESVADATILKWHKKAGDSVQRDETLVELETDKVVLEVPAPESGVLVEITVPEGKTVLADALLGKLKAGAVESAKPTDNPKAAAVAEAEPHLSPAVRRAAAEADIKVQNLQGSGKGGRIVKEDLTKTAQGAVNTVKADFRSEERVPMTRLRAKIAERLVEAQHNAAMLTTFNEINMQAVMDLRKRYKDEFEKTYGVKLGFMSFFTKAVVEALKKFPDVNASIDGTDVIYHGYYDVGIAVSTPRGLVVPIIRNAETLSLADIEKTIADSAVRARDGKLTVEEMTGGTFTITNGGVFGSLMATPIINPPQSGILGMHKIEERPIAENGVVVIRPMMYVALSYDHRIIDGRESVSFLVAVKQFLEDPARMLLAL